MSYHLSSYAIRRSSLSSRARGFTLLEVMVSLGILAVALVAIGNLNGGAVRMHVHARQLSVATQLARGKLLDIQAKLIKDGLSDYSKEYNGDFEKEGEPDFKWKAVVVKPEMDVDPEQLLSMASNGLGLNKNQQQTAVNPLASGGAMAGLFAGQVRSMTELIKQSVREVRLTVSWKAGRQEDSFDVVEHIVVLPNAREQAAANATAAVPGMPPPTGSAIPQPLPFRTPPGMPSPAMPGGLPPGGLR